MGVCGSSNNKPAKTNIETSKLEIYLKKVFFTTELAKNRRQGQYNETEKQLLSMINQDLSKRMADTEVLKASTLLSHQYYINGCTRIMVYCNVLKDNKAEIEQSGGKMSRLEQLEPYFASIIWGSVKIDLNEEALKEYKEWIATNFGSGALGMLERDEKLIKDDLKGCFEFLMPPKEKVNEFLYEFCKRHNISIESMQKAGHNLVAPAQQQQFYLNIDPGYLQGFGQNDMNIQVKIGDQNTPNDQQYPGFNNNNNGYNNNYGNYGNQGGNYNYGNNGANTPQN